MSAVRACGRPRCPVPEPDAATLRRLRAVEWPKGTVLRRGYRPEHGDPAALTPGTGNSRFAPVAGAHHVYVAATTFAALLESAFHDAAPPEPRIPVALLRRWGEAEVALRRDVRLVDLRDPELDRLGVARHQLVATAAAHYPCTRVWGEAMHGRVVGGREVMGMVWHSRQSELHARAMAHRPAVRELLRTHPAEVAVLWGSPGRASPLRATGHGLGPLTGPEGDAYVSDLVALLGIVSQE